LKKGTKKKEKKKSTFGYKIKLILFRRIL
jgi:hypothetical protein